MGQVKQQIIQSQAGLRFIAQMTFYNNGDFERLKSYIEQNYADLALMANPVERRLLDFKACRKLNGRLRVQAVIAAEKYHIALTMAAEKNDNTFRMELKVGEDYPHPVLYYDFRPIENPV
jgi:hypothetical protein